MLGLFEQVLSRSGKPEVLTGSHRPYGSNKASLNEIRRIREAGGWVCFPNFISMYILHEICYGTLYLFHDTEYLTEQ